MDQEVFTEVAKNSIECTEHPFEKITLVHQDGEIGVIFLSRCPQDCVYHLKSAQSILDVLTQSLNQAGFVDFDIDICAHDHDHDCCMLGKAYGVLFDQLSQIKIGLEKFVCRCCSHY